MSICSNLDYSLRLFVCVCMDGMLYNTKLLNRHLHSQWAVTRTKPNNFWSNSRMCFFGTGLWHRDQHFWKLCWTSLPIYLLDLRAVVAVVKTVSTKWTSASSGLSTWGKKLAATILEPVTSASRRDTVVLLVALMLGTNVNSIQDNKMPVSPSSALSEKMKSQAKLVIRRVMWKFNRNGTLCLIFLMIGFTFFSLSNNKWDCSAGCTKYCIMCL